MILSPARISKPHILIVDDELSNRMLLSRLFQASCEVKQAENGQQALEALAADSSFDIILLDIMMPGINGEVVLKTIRATPRLADLPVILISALSDQNDIVRGLQSGANDYIAKPFDVDVVYARVNTQIKMKQMMDMQKQAIAELQAAQQTKDRFFRIASHDLKSPLSNVKMVEKLLREMVGEEQGVAEVLDILRQTVTNMHGVIEEFLDTAICQSGTIEVEIKPVPVAPLILDVVANYAQNAMEKDIRLALDELPGTALADPARLAQVMNNLMSNAVKYTPRGGEVKLWSEMRSQRVRLHVADTGPGIPSNERERLFKEFSKLSNRPTGGESSTGLGLWIVKHMVTLQNGTVDVECPPQGGSDFWVELPAAV